MVVLIMTYDVFISIRDDSFHTFAGRLVARTRTVACMEKCMYAHHLQRQISVSSVSFFRTVSPFHTIVTVLE